MDSDISKGLKRKCSSTSQIKTSKRKHPEFHINITDLSDCTLLHILQFLDATSLFQLGETCYRFKQLVQDESLWIHVEARNPPNNFDKIDFCWQNVHKKTEHLLMAGSRRSEVVISLENLILSKQLCNLTVLALEYQCIKYCKLREFPSTLQELSLRHSYVPLHMDFFRFAQETMINLKTLLLDHCQWLEAGSWMSFCRLPKLEILSLYMCKKLGDDDISSISLAGKFGFKKLKVIDLRFTGLGDLFIKTFYKNPTLQVIYFQEFSSTYRIERFKRKLDVINGEAMREGSYVSDDEANNDLSKLSFTRRFHAKNLISSEAQTITDDTMRIFDRLKSTGGPKTRPKSSLYVYPYDECTCGFYDKKMGTYGSLDPTRIDDEEVLGDTKSKTYYSSSSESSDCDTGNDWDTISLQNKLEYETRKQKRSNPLSRQKGVFFLRPDIGNICHKLYDSCTLPPCCQCLSKPGTGEQKWLYVREPRNDYEISMLEHTDKNFRMRAIQSCGNPNRDCECGDICNEESNNVIVISRKEDGSLVHISQHSHSSSSNEISEEKVSDKDIEVLIKTVSEIMVNIADNEAFTTVNKLLIAFDKCLNTEEFSKFSKDQSFVHDLGTVLSYMSRNIHQNMERVLDYHFVCFKDLLKQLAKPHNVVKRKHILEFFFKNLLSSEGCDDRNNQQAVKKMYSHADEIWNRPGPSGLQSSSKIHRKRKHTKSTNKKTKGDKLPDSKNDSDSDSNMEIRKRIKPTSPKMCKRFNRRSAFIVSKYTNSYLSRDKVRFPDKRDEDFECQRPPIIKREHIKPRKFVRFDPALWPVFRNDFLVEIMAPPNPRAIPTSIKELSLRGFCVSNFTLNFLKEMELDLLDVTGTNVSFDGLQQFMMSNPQCRLIHEFACVCRPKLHF